MKNRILLFVLILVVLVLSMVMTGSASAYVPPGPDNQPWFHTDPDPKYYHTTDNLTCTTFDIDVKIYNVSAVRPIAGYEFQLWYNSSLITATQWVPINKTEGGVNPPGTGYPGICPSVDGCNWNPINNSVAPGVGRVWILAIFPVGKTWSGLDATAIRITFHIEMAPRLWWAPPPYRCLNCTLDLNGTVLGDAVGLPIPHGVDDGFYTYVRWQWPPPLWIDFDAPDYAFVCDTVTCTDTSTPPGAYIIAWKWEIEGPATNTTAMDGPVMKFHCDGPGTVNVTLTAWTSEGESDTLMKQIEQIKRAPPVGGICIPINKLALLAPHIGLTILLAVAATTVVYLKKRKRNTEINSETNN